MIRTFLLATLKRDAMLDREKKGGEEGEKKREEAEGVWFWRHNTRFEHIH